MSIINIDRAIHELRRGRSIEIDGQSFLHPEFINDSSWKELSNAEPKLIITAKRAEAVFKKSFSGLVEISIEGASIEEVVSLASGISVGDNQSSETSNQNANAALTIAREAELLPVMISVSTSSEIKVSSEEIEKYKSKINDSLTLVTDTKLNLCDAEKASIKAFRPASGGSEHLAIIVGNLNNEPLVRLHSSCYTGDLLGSLSCDCGDQLRESIKLMDEDYKQNNGGGVIIYLIQEGRGIGLINKLRAYNLQHDGMDTVEANEFLGFDDEERGFEPAAIILKKLGKNKVRIVTNNPKKAMGIEECGIKVTKRVPLIVTHEHNHHYMQTKAKKSGHIIE